MNKTKFLLMIAAIVMVASIGVKRANAWCDPGEIYCGFVVDTTVRYGHDDVERYRVGSWQNAP